MLQHEVMFFRELFAEVELARPPWRREAPLVPDSLRMHSFRMHPTADLRETPESVGKANTEHVAYPTEARERQQIAGKVAKAAGMERKTRKKAVERHYDDCGESAAGL
eukprot:795239-Lingulodinium_polyedra.AAC.1